MAGEVDIIVNALNNASGPLGGVLGSLNDLEGASNSLLERGLSPLQSMLGTSLKVAAGAAAAGIAALAAGLGSSISKAADMEQGVADIAAQMGTTSEQTAQLKDLITDLGLDPKLKVTATEAAAAIGQLGTAGMSVTDILDGAARNTVLLANATGIDFAGAASMATDVSNLWKIKAEDLGKAVDGISSAVINSKFTIQDYQYALGAAGGVASTVGVGFNDFNTTIAAISPYFAKGADAGTSFKVMLQNLVPKSDKTAEKMAELGLITVNWQKASESLSHALGHVIPADATTVYNNFIALMQKQGLTTSEAAKRWKAFIAGFKENQFFDAQGNMKDMGDIVQILHDKLGNLSEMDLNDALHKVFGTDAMRAGAALTRMTKEEFEKLQATMSKTDAEDLAATRMATFKGQMEILGGVIETVQMSVGDKFLPQLTKLAKQFSDMLSDVAPRIIAWAGNLADNFATLSDRWLPILIAKFTEWWQWGAQLVAQIPVLVRYINDIISAILTTISPVTNFISSFVSLKDIITAVAALFGIVAVQALAAFVAAWGPLLVVVGSAIAVVSTLRNAWETNWLGLRDLVLGVITSLNQQFGFLVQAFKTFGAGAMTEILNFIAGNRTNFANLTALWDTVKMAASRLFTDIQGYVTANLPLWQSKLAQWADASWQWLQNVVPVVLQKLSQLFTSLVGWLAVNLPVWIEKLYPYAMALIQWIGDAIPKAIDALTRWADSLLNWGGTTGTSKSQELMMKLGTALLEALGRVAISLTGFALTMAGDILLKLGQGLLNWMGLDINIKSLHDHMIGLIQMITDALSGKAALIGGILLAWLTPGLGSVISAIVTGFIPAIASMLGAIGGPILGALGTLASTIGGALLSGLGALATAILGPVVGAIGAFLAAAAPVILIVAAIAAAIYALYLAWQNNFLGIRDITNQVWESIKNIFTNLPASLESLKNTLYEWGSSAMGRLREGFISAQNAVRNGLDVVMDFVQQGRDQRLPPFAQSMYDAGSNAFTRLGQGAQAVKDGVVGQFNQVMTDIQNQGLGFAGGALLGRMYEGGRNFILQVGAGIANASPNMKTDLDNAFTGLRNGFNYWHDNLVPHFLNSAKDLASRIGAGFGGIDLGGAINGAMAKLRDSYNFWRDDLANHFFGSMQNLGGRIIDGLSSGIINGIGRVIQAIQGVTDALPQWVKDKLGIHSPSTLFAGFGQNIMEGFAQGIQQLADLPKQAMASATAALTDPLANMQLPQQGDGQTVNQTKNVYNDWTVNMPAGGGNGAEEQFAGMFRQLNVLYAQ